MRKRREERVHMANEARSRDYRERPLGDGAVTYFQGQGRGKRKGGGGGGTKENDPTRPTVFVRGME